MKLYWKLMWGDPNEIRDPTLIPNERIERMMTQAREQGRKDPQGQREGVLHLGEAVRELLAQWPPPDPLPAGSVPTVPAWAIEKLLETWGVPELKADDA